MSVIEFKNRRGTPPRRDGQIKVKSGVDGDDPLVRRQCTGKRGKYRSKKLALKMAGSASRRHRRPFHVYRCHLCGFIHLSSTEPRDGRFKVSVVVVPEGSNGRIGRLWLPDSEDELALEHFVDRAFHFIGLNTTEISLEA